MMLLIAACLIGTLAPRSGPDLAHMIRRQDYGGLRSALRQGADPNLPTDHPPLVLAAVLSREPAVRLLLGAGANPNVRDRRFGTPIAAAAAGNDAGIVRLLLHKGAWSGGRGGFGCPAVALTTSVRVLRILIASHCDVNSVCDDGQSALDAACSRGDTASLEVLFAAHANPNLLDRAGNSALAYDCVKLAGTPVTESARIRCATMLLRHGARVTQVNDAGETPRELALKSGFHRLARFLKRAQSGSDRGI
jgi:ankyrin repeat protein